ncbi:MAG: hypothetical protein HY334_03380 [Armatimonadetes bacterium]|nr:hypothetical protein [Armatimonadota bacterium]
MSASSGQWTTITMACIAVPLPRPYTTTDPPGRIAVRAACERLRMMKVREVTFTQVGLPTQELPLYPEERRSRRPTAEQVLRLFSLAQRHVLVAGDQVVQIFEPALTDLQQQVLRLLSVPEQVYRDSC